MIKGDKKSEGEKERGVVKGVGRENAGVEKGRFVSDRAEEEVARVVKDGKEFIPKYTSKDHDVLWASRGMIATVHNGEAIPVLQRRIYDAGFEHLDIITLGADKVLLRTDDDSDVLFLLSEASDFFDTFFTKPVKWKKDMVVRERGAWVRIFGVPLQACNPEFFKLCVYDCGRMLKVDDPTLEKIHFDYARVLVSTSSLDLIISAANVMVYGVIFDLKIVEEGGFLLGEDACLSDEDVGPEEDELGNEGKHEEFFCNGDVDILVHQLSEEWQQDQQETRASPAPADEEVLLRKVNPAVASAAEVQETAAVPAVTVTRPSIVFSQQHTGALCNAHFRLIVYLIEFR
ncbi:DUF4283 domain protein [Medicago truncatula]|uniref:DUF4283 domain protein n=1 Tax=Medicago truncatula TaxID=3880 RepID=A0A072TH72_MEDTR|nr:DUF4283 domain protein [Medicago truncatula]